MLAALATTSAAAQSWHTSLGVQGGFTRIKLTGQPGSGNQADVYGIPSTSFLGQLPLTGGLFLILPVAPKVALEPGFTLDQINGIGGGAPATFASLSLRADYALTPQFYGALGLFGYYSTSTGGPHEALQPGLEAAVGYRLHVAPSIQGRIEAQVITVKKTTNDVPFNTYSLLFGMSAPISGAAPGAARGARRPAGEWATSFGVTGGYYQVHVNGGGDATAFAFPGAGATLATSLLVAPSTPSLFVLFPATKRLAIEIGVDGQNIRGNTTIASFSIAPRADLAFGSHWYGAAGPTLHILRAVNGGTGSTVGFVGIALAWGTRFHLGGAFDGRVEANYGMTAGRARAPLGVNRFPTGAFGVTFGAMMPLN